MKIVMRCMSARTIHVSMSPHASTCRSLQFDFYCVQFLLVFVSRFFDSVCVCEWVWARQLIVKVSIVNDRKGERKILFKFNEFFGNLFKINIWPDIRHMSFARHFVAYLCVPTGTKDAFKWYMRIMLIEWWSRTRAHVEYMRKSDTQRSAQVCARSSRFVNLSFVAND